MSKELKLIKEEYDKRIKQLEYIIKKIKNIINYIHKTDMRCYSVIDDINNKIKSLRAGLSVYIEIYEPSKLLTEAVVKSYRGLLRTNVLYYECIYETLKCFESSTQYNLYPRVVLNNKVIENVNISYFSEHYDEIDSYYKLFKDGIDKLNLAKIEIDRFLPDGL